MEIEIRSDGTLERIGENSGSAPAWMPRIVERGLTGLGRHVADRMREAVEENRYTGTLEQSIRAVLNTGRMEVRIGPTAKRGRWDAGLLLELGAPNARPAWALFKSGGPLGKWTAFRGLPAWPVYYNMTVLGKGVAAHPFLSKTLQASRPEIERTAGQIGELAARAVVTIGGVEREV